MARIAFWIQMFILDKCQIYYDVTLCHKKQQKLSEFRNPNDFCFYCHVYYESPSQDTDAAGWNHSTSCNGHAFMLSRHCCESLWILATSNNFTLEEQSIITHVDINTLTNKTAHYSSSFYCFRHKVHLCNNHVLFGLFLCHICQVNRLSGQRRRHVCTFSLKEIHCRIEGEYFPSTFLKNIK